MSELASESMSTFREADAIDGGGRARAGGLRMSKPRAGLPTEIA